MGGWRRYLELRLKARTGVSSGVVLWALIALVCGAITFVFLLATVFVWLATRYDPLVAALVLTGAFLSIAILALLLSLRTHRRVVEQAELALAAQKTAFSLDPKLLGVALQVTRDIGWRKVLLLLPVVIVGAGVGMRLIGRQREKDERGADDGDERPAFSRAA
jgi:hypothetical protein